MWNLDACLEGISPSGGLVSIDPFNKEKVLVEAFSRHCETSWRFVDSSRDNREWGGGVKSVRDSWHRKMSATKSNVEHRFEKNDKLTRNKSSRNKKVNKIRKYRCLECVSLVAVYGNGIFLICQDHQDLEESFLSMKLQPETSKREKTSFKINKCSKGEFIFHHFLS